jgi:predicted dehydrogenase
VNHTSLVIGLGSAGQRHSDTLQKLGSQVTEISRRESAKEYLEIVEQTAAKFEHDLIIISTETSQHQKLLDGILATGYTGKILIEKPGLAKLTFDSVSSSPKIYVGYNLRYLQAIMELKELIASGAPPIRASIVSRSFLPSWRPGDVREDQYSKVASLGGGALYDLSHEIDYSQWIFGKLENVKSLGGKSGNVTHDADDSWKFIGSTTICSQISIDLSLTSHIPQRECLVEFDDFTVRIDLMSGETFFSDRPNAQGNSISQTYEIMLRDLMIESNHRLPTLKENMLNLDLINRVKLDAKLDNRLRTSTRSEM